MESIFEEGQITMMYAHRHPYGFLSDATPSLDDFQMFRSLGQSSSWLSHHGQLVRFWASGRY